MTTVLLVFQFILAILITIAVMLQKSSSIGLGAYSGSNDSLFGAKGSSGFLVKLTITLSLLFVVNTVSLAYIYSSSRTASVVDDAPAARSWSTTVLVTAAIPLPISPWKNCAMIFNG